MVKIEDILGVSGITPAEQGLVEVPKSLSIGASVLLCAEALAAFSVLHQAAASQGFDARITSGYRSFERQLLIWNNKAEGKRPVLDKNECPLDVRALAPEALLGAILHWSAVPGMSRHHWGSDFDIYDAQALGDAPLQLTVAEANTRFSPFYEWLEGYLPQQKELFRPYDGRGGVAAEPWHLSYRPQALRLQEAFTEAAMLDFYRTSSACQKLALREQVLEDFAAIYAEYMQPYLLINE